MYEGWIGSSMLLHHIFEVSGEAAYDLVMIEMVIISWSLLVTIYVAILFRQLSSKSAAY